MPTVGSNPTPSARAPLPPRHGLRSMVSIAAEARPGPAGSGPWDRPPLRRLSFPPCSGLATCGKGAPSREPPRPTGALRPLTSPRPAARPSRRGQEGRSMDHRNVVHTSARHRRGTVALTCLLSLVGCALGTAVAGSGVAGASPAVRYVALGDSYT